VRQIISDKCSTSYAAERTSDEKFCTNPAEIRRRLLLTDEMRLIMMFEDSFPSGGFIDCIDFLKPLERSSSSIDLLSLRKLRTMLDTLRKVTSFFNSVKDEVYPNLKKMSSGILSFPEVHRRIDNIIDRYGEVKDTASDELYEIRRSLREKEGTISRRMSAILRKAQEEGIVDADADVTVRDGKFLIPVGTSAKRKIQGFVHDVSASGKTAFVEPAEIIELENDIAELRFEEGREIQKILFEFTEFFQASSRARFSSSRRRISAIIRLIGSVIQSLPAPVPAISTFISVASCSTLSI
jgi:DNA mismatch repair protein MutS2